MINKKRRRTKKNTKNLLEKFHQEISKDIDTSKGLNLSLFKQPKVKNVKVFDEEENDVIYEK
jgi:hypothetical protein